MPTPTLHLPIAYDVAQSVRLEAKLLPSFLLGSVAPDVAQWQKRPRGVTHFWDLDNDISGAVRMLSRYQHLRASNLPSVDRAFIAGYLCHLVTDEQWTFCIWRPYFGRHTPFGGGPEGVATQSLFRDVLDDNARHVDPSPAELAHRLVDAPRVAATLCPWLDPAELRQFQEFVVQRVAGNGPLVVTKEHRAAFTLVAPQSVDDFHVLARQESTVVLEQFLAGGPIPEPLGTSPLGEGDFPRGPT